MTDFKVGDRVRINSRSNTREWHGIECEVVQDYQSVGRYIKVRALSGKPFIRSPFVSLSAYKFDLIEDEPVVEEDWT